MFFNNLGNLLFAQRQPKSIQREGFCHGFATVHTVVNPSVFPGSAVDPIFQFFQIRAHQAPRNLLAAPDWSTAHPLMWPWPSGTYTWKNSEKYSRIVPQTVYPGYLAKVARTARNASTALTATPVSAGSFGPEPGSILDR